MTVSETATTPVELRAGKGLERAGCHILHITRNDPGVDPTIARAAHHDLAELHLRALLGFVSLDDLVDDARTLYRRYRRPLGLFGGRALLETALLTFTRELGRPLTPNQLTA